MAVFEKGIRLRHIGHLDIQRAMMRALRRSGLPVAYSNGYNPHILLTFASALSTGAAGKKEILDVTMAREASPDDFLQQMNRALPPDLQLSFARALDDKHPAMMHELGGRQCRLCPLRSYSWHQGGTEREAYTPYRFYPCKRQLPRTCRKPSGSGY